MNGKWWLVNKFDEYMSEYMGSRCSLMDSHASWIKIICCAIEICECAFYD